MLQVGRVNVQVFKRDFEHVHVHFLLAHSGESQYELSFFTLFVSNERGEMIQEYQ